MSQLDSILWPLFHYHPGEITFDESAWEAYKEANRLFAKSVAKEVQDGDLIWVHDYHLMLLPEMLREEIGDTKENIKIGFFLHTPFPSSEIYRILPVRNELLLGVLHCDLIGFHTYDYTRHFLSACSRLLYEETRFGILCMEANLESLVDLQRPRTASSSKARSLPVAHSPLASIQKNSKKV